uniref:Uncharacterized protein n=1 Tax=Anguilla anguilla TaxID=7936 RepID=A0A0E9SX39_ANGAN
MQLVSHTFLIQPCEFLWRFVLKPWRCIVFRVKNYN